MKRILKGLVLTLLFVFLAVGVFLMSGEREEVNFSASNSSSFNSIIEVEAWIAEEGLRHPSLREEARAELVFANTTKQKTPYSLVYIHGFSASKGEGDPVHKAIADSLGMNLYLNRLPAHGLDNEDAFVGLKANDLISEVKSAIEIGQLIGERVVVMATSTGATLSLIQASNGMDIEALILYSPLIDFYDDRMKVFGLPRGIEIARQIVGSDYIVSEPSNNEIEDRIWYNKYNIEGLKALSSLVNATMIESTFNKIETPVFLGYYYKDDENQDKTVSVEAMKTMYAQLATADSLKEIKVYPNAGAHVICSSIKSSSVEEVILDTKSFLQNKVFK